MAYKRPHHTRDITDAIIYARVSTLDQATEGVSLEAQRIACRGWAGMYAQGANEYFYVDEGISGSSLAHRPQLNRALDQVAISKKPVFVTYSLSRLSRSTQDTLWIAEYLESNNCELVSLSEHIDTTTAAGKMVFRMLAVLAEFERDQVSERTRLGMEQLRREGKRFSRYPEYPPEVRERIQRAHHKDGKGFAEIARELEDEGVPTITGAPWSRHVVRKVALRNQ